MLSLVVYYIFVEVEVTKARSSSKFYTGEVVMEKCSIGNASQIKTLHKVKIPSVDPKRHKMFHQLRRYWTPPFCDVYYLSDHYEPVIIISNTAGDFKICIFLKILKTYFLDEYCKI